MPLGVGAVRVTITQNRVPHLSKRLQAIAGRNCERTAKGLRDSWKSRVHVITGAYRDSIEAVKVGPNNWQVFAGVEYAVWEEYGTRFRPGHPAFTPAVLEWGPKFEASLDRMLDEL